ncbi:STAS domain-containing protein [Parasediminibacterium paludis]|uniref:STAS domain-containing protein n=1 Tax=Parasediminibacterium paludis TaxID=908966 RepID=A0ABV8PUM7_9BACT
MKFKIDTKEKFTVVTPIEPHFADNVTADFNALCGILLQKDIKNTILNMANVIDIDDASCDAITQWQQRFYEANASFVICEMTSEIEATFDKLELTDVLNITPTESEAWDIVQMEEIERELLDGDDFEFEVNE